MEEQGDVSGRLPSISNRESKIAGEKHSSDDLVESRDFCPKIRRLDPKLDSDSSKQLPKGYEPSKVTNKEARNNVCELQRGIELDLNADAVSIRGKDELSPCSSSIRAKSKSRDALSECGSSNVRIEENDPMKRWKAMKKNGFLSNPHGGIASASSCFVSSSHGGIPAPRKRGRKSKNEAMKKKMEIARKEDADRFAKLAAPSGLLNELNPGIINHVRNKRQVLSIIENLVKSEKESQNFQQALNMHSSMEMERFKKNPEDLEADGLRSEGKRCMPRDKHPPSIPDVIGEQDKTLGDKIQSETNVPERTTSLSLEESCTTVLTVKAATVASQWLELLHQDIKGRLLALRRSKKRVRAVISTELPFLIVKEFPSNQEDDRGPPDGISISTRADIHKTRWTALFTQMEQTLSEEETLLEKWMNRVNQMQAHCDQGLQQLTGHHFLQLGMSLDSRSGDGSISEKELAVRAAAASIYSTCHFLMSQDNITCT